MVFNKKKCFLKLFVVNHDEYSKMVTRLNRSVLRTSVVKKVAGPAGPVAGKTVKIAKNTIQFCYFLTVF